jgi:hypothetical protein
MAAAAKFFHVEFSRCVTIVKPQASSHGYEQVCEEHERQEEERGQEQDG